MGINSRIQLQPVPLDSVAEPVDSLAPVSSRDVAQTKGYFFGGLFGGPDKMREIKDRIHEMEEERRLQPSIGQRIQSFMSENPDFTRSLISVYSGK